MLNATRGDVVGDQVRVADGVWSRFIGLLGTSSLDPGSGLLIYPSQGVHTLGMRFPIDVVFLSHDHKVVGLRECLKPFRVTPLNWDSAMVLELPAGTIRSRQIEVAHQLAIEPIAG